MVKILLEEEGTLPQYATELASGADVKALKLINVFRGQEPIEKERLQKLQDSFDKRGFVKLRGFERGLFGTKNIVHSMPNNKEIQVRPRSGLALKRGLTVFNSPGTIDADYKGEICVIIINNTPFLNLIEKGEKIAQLVVCDVDFPRPVFEKTEEETQTSERGVGGFGSTGK